jgi:ComF family protein
VALLALHLAAALFAELVAPSRCAACDGRVLPRVLFCPPCAASVHRSEGHGAFEYGGAIATAIMRLKYLDRADLAPRLALAMVPACPDNARSFDLVVPVPLHPRRMAERGYNHAALLAGPVARGLGLELSPRALVRIRDTPRQASLDRAARLENLRDAFAARADLAGGARIVLVDDVRTTGATLEACTAALRAAGAEEVLPLTLACRS